METLQRTANRGSVSTGYDVANSLKVESDNNEYLERSTSGASDGSSTQHTISVWVKRTELGVDSEPVSAGGIGRFRFESDDTFSYQFRSGKELITTRLFRDTSAWYHIVAAADSSQATASNRMKVYVNGVQVTDFGTAVYQDQDQASPAWGKNTLYSLRVGAAASSTRNFNGYIAEMYYIDGQTLTPTSFGEFDSDSGIWKPKKFSGTHGTLDTYLDFSDSSNLGKNSGGTTDLTANNISAADQATDTCTNNFAIQNVIRQGTDRMPLMSEGATEIGHNANSYRYSPATIGVTKGKWYWEIKPTVNGNTLVSGAGIASNQTTFYFYDVTGNFVYHYDGDRYVNGSAVSSYGAAWSTNDIIGFAYDADNWTLTAYVNNSSQGNLLASQTDISSELFIPYVYSYGTHTYQTNFGGYTTMSNTHTNTDANGFGNFVYTPPSGYYAICTKNLAEFG